MTGRSALVVRLDSMGDMLVCGPAIRAVADTCDQVTVLAGPRGADAARMLPGVDEVLTWNCPWIAAPPAPAVDPADIAALVTRVRHLAVTEALVLTSFHQSALPTALVLRLAGVARIAAVSEDYPGALLDVRIAAPADAPEPVRMLAIAEAAGYRLPADDAGHLEIADVLDPPDEPPLPERYVVLHPGVDAPARAYPAQAWAQVARMLAASGRSVVLTGSADDAEACATIAAACAGQVLRLDGRTDLPQLAAVLRGADVVAVANTGPAHLAAAVGTPVVSLFAPVVPALRWAPYGRDVTVLGNQDAACRGTRARECPIAGHPCLTCVCPSEVVTAIEHAAERSFAEAVR